MSERGALVEVGEHERRPEDDPYGLVRSRATPNPACSSSRVATS